MLLNCEDQAMDLFIRSSALPSVGSPRSSDFLRMAKPTCGWNREASKWSPRVSVTDVLCVLSAFMLAFVFFQETLAAESSSAVDETVLDPSWLIDTQHPQTGLLSRSVRPEEGVGYFAILNHASQLPLQALKAAAKRFERERLAVVKNDPSYRFYFRKSDAEFPTFVDLFRAPAAYHGQPVTFRGHVRRIISFSAGENAHRFQQLHEVWLYAGESQQNPVVIICSELPPGIPTGPDQLVDFVSVTGYFFKRYGYEDRTGQTRFAPLILAQRLEWNPPARRTHWLSTTAVFSLPVGVAVLIAIICWRSSRQDRLAIHRIAESGDDANSFADH